MHVSTYYEVEPCHAQTVLNGLYVDDLSLGVHTVNEAFQVVDLILESGHPTAAT